MFVCLSQYIWSFPLICILLLADKHSQSASIWCVHHQESQSGERLLKVCSHAVFCFLFAREDKLTSEGESPLRAKASVFLLLEKINCRGNRLQRYKHSRKAHKSRWPSRVPRLPCMGIKVINTKIRPLAAARRQEKDPRQLKMKHRTASHRSFIFRNKIQLARWLTKEWPMVLISTPTNYLRLFWAFFKEQVEHF